MGRPPLQHANDEYGCSFISCGGPETVGDFMQKILRLPAASGTWIRDEIECTRNVDWTWLGITPRPASYQAFVAYALLFAARCSGIKRDLFFARMTLC